MKFLRLLITSAFVLSLCSCGLVQLPFRVVGGVVKGTAQVGRAAVNKPKEAHAKRKARKEEERKSQEAKDTEAQDMEAQSIAPIFGERSSFDSDPAFGTESAPLPEPNTSDPPVNTDPPLPTANE